MTRGSSSRTATSITKAPRPAVGSAVCAAGRRSRARHRSSVVQQPRRPTHHCGRRHRLWRLLTPWLDLPNRNLFHYLAWYRPWWHFWLMMMGNEVAKPIITPSSSSAGRAVAMYPAKNQTLGDHSKTNVLSLSVSLWMRYRSNVPRKESPLLLRSGRDSCISTLAAEK
jgi:hypothetical protein